MVKRGEPWGEPPTTSHQIEVTGGDAALASVCSGPHGPVVWFRPSTDCDLARAVGLTPGAEQPGRIALPVDAILIETVPIHLEADASGPVHAVNAVVVGTPPDRQRWRSPRFAVEVVVDGKPAFAGRATGVIVASGQYLRGLDVVPRGHPGDGRLEVQVYAPRRGERSAVRARLRQGAHLPHARIVERRGTAVEVRVGRGTAPLEVDGGGGWATGRVRLEVVPQAVRVLV
jgi:hypothetical protein